MKQRFIRPDGELADDTMLVVRGGVLDRALLEDDARRAHAVYGTYSVSVFAADGVTVDELVQEPRQQMFRSSISQGQPSASVQGSLMLSLRTDAPM